MNTRLGVLLWISASVFIPQMSGQQQPPDKLRAIERKVDEHSTRLGEQSKKIDSVEKRSATTEEKAAGLQQELNRTKADLTKAVEKVDGVVTNAGVTRRDLDRFWVLLAAVLVFFMQAGFKCLEVGMARRHHDGMLGMMNLMNWLILCIIFYCWGFGIMFGHSYHGIFGTSLYFPDAGAVQNAYQPLGLEFLLFQLAFAGTTATIVDGAIAERTALLPYMIATVLGGTLIYPVFGHWAWNEHGWLLGNLKFHDFAGSTVVHSVGAWMSLSAALFVGPRRYRFTNTGTEGFSSSSVGYAVLGVIMLWFGWWGFNGGSKLRYDETIASIILHTNLAGATGGLMAYLHAMCTGQRSVYEKTIGGVLGGLVAITASCDVVSPAIAMLIGASAGLVHNWAFELLPKLRIDDVAGAIPVHGACGVWGTLCTGFVLWFTTPGGSPAQVGVQLVGILAAFLYAGGVSCAIFWIIEKFMGLRTSLAEEDGGGADSLIGEYDGGLRVTAIRPLGFWSRIRSFESYMRETQLANPSPRQARVYVATALTSRKSQFIRDDDSEANERDVTAALDRYFS